MNANQSITDILFRGRFDRGVELRADADPTTDDVEPESADDTTMVGHFSRFDDWYEIDSWLEGHFIERTVKGAFAKTIKENRDTVKVAFDHGYDFQIGDKPLGPIDVLREEDEGPYYEVPLLDTDYNRDFVLPALQGRTMDGRKFGSTLGASFRFRVTRDEWVMEPKKSTHNPDGIPERTIKEVRLFEFGPVVYPASPAATAGVRCLTDWYHDRHRERSERSGRPIASLAADPGTSDVDPAAPLIEHPEVSPVRASAAQIAAFTTRLRVSA